MKRLKKYFVFILSFGLLYIAVQIVSGWLLTALYIPNLSSMNNAVSQEVVFGQTSTIPFLTILLVATLAYVFAQKLFVTTNKGS